MLSLALSQKWWAGIVAGVFSIAGVGTALVAVPAFAESGRSVDLATATGVSLRLECKKGAWTGGSFQWTSGASQVGSPVALPDCPGTGTRRVVTLPNITMPGTGTAPATGAATADGFLIRVSGKADSGVATAACTLPSPTLASNQTRRQHVTLTCAADGGSRAQQVHLKVKAQWLGVQGANDDDDEDGPGNSGKDKKNNGNNGNNSNRGKGNSDKSSWLGAFSRERLS